MFYPGNYLTKLLLTCFKASTAFWVCAISGCIAFIYSQSYIVYFYGGDYVWNIVSTITTCILTILIVLLYRHLYLTRGWDLRSPLEMIPISCLYTFLFSYVSSFFSGYFFYHINVYDLTVGLFKNPLSYPWIGGLGGLYLQNIYLILSVLMIYVFIHCERRDYEYKKPDLLIFLKAGLAILVLHEYLHSLSVFIYYNIDGYLYSSAYFWGDFYKLAISVALSLYIFLIRPGDELAGSRLLPILPQIFCLVVFSGILCMWGFKLLIHIDRIIGSQSADEFLYQIKSIFMTRQPLWNTGAEFFGWLQSKCWEQLLMALFFLTCTFTYRWKNKTNNEKFHIFDIRRSIHFWAYNFSGWSVTGLYLYFSDLLELDEGGKDISRSYIISFIIIGAMLGSILRSMMKHYQLVDVNLIRLTYRLVFISTIFGLLHACALTIASYLYVYATSSAQDLLDKQHAFSGIYYFYKTFAWFSLCFLVWLLIYQISITQRNKTNNALKNLMLEKSLKEIQLNTLSSKIDPHFIFNALNNIRALINEDRNKAREAILVLSDILRQPLTKSSSEKVMICEEIELIRNYIVLSKIQLEDRINYEEQIAEAANPALIPPMMLQILVENAIKHGISQAPEGGSLSLNIYKKNNNLICRVVNTGNLTKSSTTKGFGVGLLNIKERLNLLYGQTATFSLTEDIASNRVIAELILPLEYMP